MSFYTPNGLKIRLDSGTIAFVLFKHGLFPASSANHAGIGIDMNDVQLNTELWVNLPNATSNLVALFVAITWQSWEYTLLAALVGYLLGYMVSNVSYLPFLRRLLPQFLGSGIISFSVSIVFAFVFWSRGNTAFAILAPIIVLLNWLHFTDVLQLFFLPIGIVLRRAAGINTGWSEFAFMMACRDAARQHDVELDWSIYGAAARASV